MADPVLHCIGCASGRTSNDFVNTFGAILLKMCSPVLFSLPPSSNSLQLALFEGHNIVWVWPLTILIPICFKSILIHSLSNVIVILLWETQMCGLWKRGCARTFVKLWKWLINTEKYEVVRVALSSLSCVELYELHWLWCVAWVVLRCLSYMSCIDVVFSCMSYGSCVI